VRFPAPMLARSRALRVESWSTWCLLVRFERVVRIGWRTTTLFARVEPRQSRKGSGMRARKPVRSYRWPRAL